MNRTHTFITVLDFKFVPPNVYGSIYSKHQRQRCWTKEYDLTSPNSKLIPTHTATNNGLLKRVLSDLHSCQYGECRLASLCVLLLLNSHSFYILFCLHISFFVKCLFKPSYFSIVGLFSYWDKEVFKHSKYESIVVYILYNMVFPIHAPFLNLLYLLIKWNLYF